MRQLQEKGIPARKGRAPQESGAKPSGDIQDGLAPCYCTRCGAPLEPKARYCTKCGAAVSEPADLVSPDSASSQERGRPNHWTLGKWVFFGGLAVLIYFWAVFDTSVPVPETIIGGTTVGGGRVHNIGLLQEQQLGVIIGLAIALVGIALHLVEKFAGSRRK